MVGEARTATTAQTGARHECDHHGACGRLGDRQRLHTVRYDGVNVNAVRPKGVTQLMAIQQIGLVRVQREELRVCRLLGPAGWSRCWRPSL